MGGGSVPCRTAKTVDFGVAPPPPGLPLTLAARPCSASQCHLTRPASHRCYALVPCAGTGTRAGGAGAEAVRRDRRCADGRAYAGGARRRRPAEAGAGGARSRRRGVRAPGQLPPASASDLALRRATRAPRRWRRASAGSCKQGARPDDWVLVHDAARCLVRAEWIDRLIDVCADDPVGGLLAMPVADTLKRESTGRVRRRCPRRRLAGADAADVPHRPARRRARGRRRDATDEASAMEGTGRRRSWCPGRRRTSRSPTRGLRARRGGAARHGAR